MLVNCPEATSRKDIEGLQFTFPIQHISTLCSSSVLSERSVSSPSVSLVFLVSNKEQEGMPHFCKSDGSGCVSMRHKRVHLPCLRFTGPKVCVHIAQDFMERIDLSFLSRLPDGTSTTLTLPPLLKSLACSPTEHCTVSCGHSPAAHHPLVKLS